MIYHAGILVRSEFDTTGKGKIDQWLFYDARGNVVRAEYDRNGDGKPDQWEHFAAGQRQPYKVERDTTGDGKADAIWEQEEASRSQRR